MLRDRQHPHLIWAIAYFTLGDKRYIMSPWAEFGNLREFWDQDKIDASCRNLTPRIFKWAFTQLVGLAGAINSLHDDPVTKGSWRHGDLKPENILCFKNVGGMPQPELYQPCILVIADTGLAMHHTEATHERSHETRTRSGTIMYEPPETELDRNQKKGRSRRYDIWSMGCIYLEFIIWMLYGSVELERFLRDFGAIRTFYQLDSTKRPILHHVVEAWADHIRRDPRCPPGTAVRSLLDLTINRLLCTDMGVVPTANRTQTTLIHSGSGTTRTKGNLPKSPAVLLRAPTIQDTSSRISTSHRMDGRATAHEMELAVQEIYTKATIDEGANNSWIVFDAAVRLGPNARQYRERLAESDALPPIISASQSGEVRSQYPALKKG